MPAFRREYKQIFRSSGPGYVKDWAKDYFRYLQSGNDLQQSRETIVQTLRIGSVAVVLVPGHILHQTSVMIKDACRQNLVSVAPFANDMSVGYLPPAEEYPKGRYEVTGSWKYYGLLQPLADAEQTIRETAVRQLREIFS